MRKSVVEKTGLLRGCREVTVINKAINDTRREKEKTREERERKPVENRETSPASQAECSS